MNIIMEEADIIKNLETMLQDACEALQRAGKLDSRVSQQTRDWWGKRKAQMRAKADLPMEKWRD